MCHDTRSTGRLRSPKMAGIGAHNFPPLGLRDFILAKIKRLANDDPVHGPRISLVVVRPHHELAGGMSTSSIPMLLRMADNGSGMPAGGERRHSLRS